MNPQNDWQPTFSIEMLQRRAELLRRVRLFFDERGFFEVQTPHLSHDTIVDRYLDPIPVEISIVGQPHRFFLQTSPEFAMKRLLAAGAEAIYQIGAAFRAGEAGSQHNPEFTMLEWYRAGDSYAEGMKLLSDFSQAILQLPRAEIIGYRQAFARFAGVDPFTASDAELQALLPRENENSRGFDRDNLLNWIMADRVEPNLGIGLPSIVCDWPPSQAALAQVRQDAVPVAERFELFVGGVELANGYHELTDAAELTRRMEYANAQRRADGSVSLPTGNRLQAAMQSGLPDCCGVAVGFDRLLMVASGSRSIRDVIAFPIERA